MLLRGRTNVKGVDRTKLSQLDPRLQEVQVMGDFKLEPPAIGRLELPLGDSFECLIPKSEKTLDEGTEQNSELLRNSLQQEPNPSQKLYTTRDLSMVK